MNARILALREAKVHLVSRLRGHARRLQRVQRHLPPHLHLRGPALPALRPGEVPERRLRCGRATLVRYAALRANRLAMLLLTPLNQNQIKLY